MNLKTTEQIKSFARLFVAASVVGASLPLQPVQAQYRDGIREQESRGISSRQVAAAQKASEAAVARMNANVSQLGHQNPVLMPGQVAITEIQTTITDMRKARKEKVVSLPVLNAIALGGLLGEVVNVDEKTRINPDGDTHSRFSGRIKEMDGTIRSFNGVYDFTNEGNYLEATINYQDGRVSQARFERNTEDGSYNGSTRMMYPGKNLAQDSSVWFSQDGKTVYMNTTVYDTANDQEWKSLAKTVASIHTVVGDKGQITKSVYFERVDGPVGINGSYVEVDGKSTGEMFDGETNTKTSFSSDVVNGEKVWKFDSVQTLDNGTKIHTVKNVNGNVTTFETTKTGVVETMFEGAIVGDWNLNGKVDAGEPWGKFIETSKGTLTRSNDSVTTDETRTLKFESGELTQTESVLTEKGLSFVSLVPGFPLERISKRADGYETPIGRYPIITQINTIQSDGSKVTGKTATQGDGSYISKYVTLAQDGTHTETTTQGSVLKNGTRTVVSNVVARAPNGDVTLSVVSRKVDAKGLAVQPILVRFTKNQKDGTKVTGETVSQTDGSYVSRSRTLKIDGTVVDSVTEGSVLKRGVRTLITRSYAREPNGNVTRSETSQVVDAHGSLMNEKITRFNKYLSDGTKVTGVTTTQKDGSYVSTSSTIKKDGTRIESQTVASALVNGKRTIITQTNSLDPKGLETKTVTYQVVDANGNPVTQPLVKQGVARYNAMGQLVGIY